MGGVGLACLGAVGEGAEADATAGGHADVLFNVFEVLVDMIKRR